jgi:long-chain-fatty-acid--CoA ligase ACSBG
MDFCSCWCIFCRLYWSTTNTPEACHYISEHSRTPIVVLENNLQLQKYAEIGHRLPHLQIIVIWAEEPKPELIARTGKTVYTWSEFLQRGASTTELDVALEARMAGVRPGHCCSIIYTSGTTGPPKAVMISHDNYTWVSRNIGTNVFSRSQDDRYVSYLPFSHAAAQLVDIFGMLFFSFDLFLFFSYR